MLRIRTCAQSFCFCCCYFIIQFIIQYNWIRSNRFFLSMAMIKLNKKCKIISFGKHLFLFYFIDCNRIRQMNEFSIDLFQWKFTCKVKQFILDINFIRDRLNEQKKTRIMYRLWILYDYTIFYFFSALA